MRLAYEKSAAVMLHPSNECVLSYILYNVVNCANYCQDRHNSHDNIDGHEETPTLGIENRAVK